MIGGVVGVVRGPVDIGFVDQHHRAGGLVVHQPFDLGHRRHGAGGIVGVHHIIDAGIRIGRQHRLDVMAIVGGQRHLGDRRIDELRGPHGIVVGGIGHHHALGGRAIGDDGARQDAARARIDGDMVFRNILDGRDGLGQPVSISPLGE